MKRITDIEKIEHSRDIPQDASVAFLDTSETYGRVLKICDCEQVDGGVNFKSLIALVADADGEARVFSEPTETQFMSDEDVATREIRLVDFKKMFLAVVRSECCEHCENKNEVSK